jgi:hypothetical protein
MYIWEKFKRICSWIGEFLWNILESLPEVMCDIVENIDFSGGDDD